MLRVAHATNKPMTRSKKAQKMYRRRQKRNGFLRNYKAKRGCAKCGERDWRVLSFHSISGHRGGRRNTLSRLAGRSVGWQRIKDEISLCKVLCFDCHDRLHQEIHAESKAGKALVALERERLGISKGKDGRNETGDTR